MVKPMKNRKPPLVQTSIEAGFAVSVAQLASLPTPVSPLERHEAHLRTQYNIGQQEALWQELARSAAADLMGHGVDVDLCQNTDMVVEVYNQDCTTTKQPSTDNHSTSSDSDDDCKPAANPNFNLRPRPDQAPCYIIVDADSDEELEEEEFIQDEEDDEDYKQPTINRKRSSGVASIPTRARAKARTIPPTPRVLTPNPTVARPGLPSHAIPYATTVTIRLNKMLWCCSYDNMELNPIIEQLPRQAGPRRIIHHPSSLATPIPREGMLVRRERSFSTNFRIKRKKNPFFPLSVIEYQRRLAMDERPTPPLSYADRKLAMQNLHSVCVLGAVIYRPDPSTTPIYHKSTFTMAKSWHTITASHVIPGKDSITGTFSAPLHQLIVACEDAKQSSPQKKPKKAWNGRRPKKDAEEVESSAKMRTYRIGVNWKMTKRETKENAERLVINPSLPAHGLELVKVHMGYVRKAYNTFRDIYTDYYEGVQDIVDFAHDDERYKQVADICDPLLDAARSTTRDMDNLIQVMKEHNSGEHELDNPKAHGIKIKEARKLVIAAFRDLHSFTGFDPMMNLRKLARQRTVSEAPPSKICPACILDTGIEDFRKAVSTVKAKNKLRHIRQERYIHFNFKRRSTKDIQQSYTIPKQQWNSRAGFVKSRLLLHAKVVRHKQSGQSHPNQLPDLVDHAVKIVMHKCRKVHFHFSYDCELKPLTSAPSEPTSYHATIALDPGSCCMMSMYDADCQCIEWGKEDLRQLEYYQAQYDGIKSTTSIKIEAKQVSIDNYKLLIGDNPTPSQGQTLTTMQKRLHHDLGSLNCAAHRKLYQISNKISECHNKLALFLCENYRVILLPVFNVSSMVTKKKPNGQKRTIARTTARNLLTWNHFKFRQLLLAKAELYPWVQVVLVTEAYTSKTCGQCGNLNKNLGSSKVFDCPDCTMLADRDVHAAKNILLRYLTLNNIH